MLVIAVKVIHLIILDFPDAETHIRCGIHDISKEKHRLNFYRTNGETAPPGKAFPLIEPSPL